MKVLFYSLCILWVVTLIGCTDTTDNPSNSDAKPIMMVWAHAYDEYRVNDDSIIYVNHLEICGFVLGSPMPQVQSVLLNGTVMTNLEICEYADGLWFEAVQIGGQVTGSKEVSVVLDKGTATGTVTVPSLPMIITSPQDGDTINFGSNLAITWIPNATYSDLDVDAGDSAYKWYEIIDDTLLTGNTFTVPGSMLFPLDNIERIRLDLYSFNGTFPKPGAVANMEGTAVGFLMASNGIGDENDEIDIYVKNSGAGKILAKTRKSGNRFYKREFLRRAAAKFLGRN